MGGSMKWFWEKDLLKKLPKFKHAAIIVFLFICISSPLCAEEKKAVTPKPILDNKGFIKNPPKSLREKFPMCNAFLNVEWIDKEKKIGYSNYEIILNENKERKMMWSLVWLNDLWPQAIIDVYRYKKEGKLNELFSFIRRGKIISTPSYHLGIKDAERTEYFITTSPNPFNSTWSDNQQTVCIACPDGARAWIIEGKTVKNGLNETEKAILAKKIIKGLGHREEWFNALWLLDINHDGKMDYVRGEAVEYSFGEEYYLIERVKLQAGFGAWRFPPLNKECVVNKEVRWAYNLFTDGYNYYLSNECNLTELTSSNKKE